MTAPLAEEFRAVMAGVATPVSVVTTLTDGRPHGTTVSAFASLSMDPPMVLVSLDRGSGLLARLAVGGVFGVNVLGRDQAPLALAFARKGAKGPLVEKLQDGVTAAFSRQPCEGSRRLSVPS